MLNSLQWGNISILIKKIVSFLNQACAGHRPACAWFLKLLLSVNVCVFVPTLERLPLTTGVMWHDMDPI